MKTLILGDSHAGFLYASQQKHLVNCNIDFLALGGPALVKNIEQRIGIGRVRYREDIKRTKLVSTFDLSSYLDTSSLKLNREILNAANIKHILKEYDLIFIYGFGLRSGNVEVKWFSHLLVNSTFYSEQVKARTIESYAFQCRHYNILRNWVNSKIDLNGKRIISIPSPLPNELHQYYAQNNDQMSPKFASDTTREIEQRFKKLGISFYDAPLKLANEKGIATRSEFKVKNPKDFKHINMAGGKLMLESILDLVEA